MDDAKKAGLEFEKLVGILDTLRGENGCPWDKKQDENSILNYFLEEVYEAIDALLDKNYESLAEEFGDILMEIVFFARIFKEKGHFTISEAVRSINEKMIKRHPHVFSGFKVNDSSEVISEWNKQKKIEKKRSSNFDGLAKTSPALLTAFQIGQRASALGFDWEQSIDVLQKLKEEIIELEEALEGQEGKIIEEEIGDILFSIVNLARHLSINPEISLKKANDKFMKRFKYIERELEEKGKDVKEATLEEMETLWEKSKYFEKK